MRKTYGDILGVQANFWSHIDRTEPRFDKQIFPRLCALGEVAWTPEELKDWEDFKTRYPANVRRLDYLEVNSVREGGMPELPPEMLSNPKTAQIGYWKTPVAVQNTVKEWNVSKHIKGAGEYTVLFQYTHGNCRLGIEMASIEVNGKEISGDTHRGEAGNNHEDNSYMLRIDDLPADATITLKASIRAEGGTDSNGSVYIVKNGSSDKSMGSSKPL